jgi:hypothetical protein
MLRVCSVVPNTTQATHSFGQGAILFTMTNKIKRLNRSRYSARALWQSQANAPWDVSMLTGGSTDLGNRASRVAHNRIGLKRRRYPTYQADKVEALLKLLQTDKFIGSVSLKHTAKYMESVKVEEETSYTTEENSCRK